MLAGLTFDPGPLHGEVRVPGDKSVSHRALIAAASLGGPVRIANLNPGRDVRATTEALSALGAQIERLGCDIEVEASRLRESSAPIDCMNSGSTARMLLGACTGANVPVRLDGDDSLRQRPMEPVAAALRAFGARIETTDGHLPLAFHGTPRVETRNFILLSPSAQVKSALLFAGLFAGVAIRITGDRGSRDHTERLIRYLGGDIEWDGRTVAFQPRPLVSRPLGVVGDFSSAAFFITAATITPGSAIVVRDVGVNPTRAGLLDALLQMGARIELRAPRAVSGEPLADIAVSHAPLRAIAVGTDLALRAIDEIPLLSVAAAFAQGETRIAGVRDLRTKESDRVAGIERLLAAAGIATSHAAGELTVCGGTPSARDGVIETQGDHRIAMAAAILASAAGPIAIDSGASIDVSFPGFLPALESLRRRR